MKKEDFEAMLAVVQKDDIDKKKVNEKTSLDYLSWAKAVELFTKQYPNFTYEIMTFENNLPYVYDEKTGYMVFTKITIDGETKQMWLPVMNYALKPVKGEACSMNDINKAIMRCLVKNMAMFGLGLSIYTGEDLPSEDDGTSTPARKKKETPENVQNNEAPEEFITPASSDQVEKMREYIDALGLTNDELMKELSYFKVKNIDDLVVAQANKYIVNLKKRIDAKSQQK